LGDAAAGLVAFAGEGERDVPVELMLVFVDGDLVGAQVDGGIGVAEMEITEVVLDDLGLEPEAQDEAPKAVPGIGSHHMPENGMLADGDHRFGAEFRFLLDARAQAAAQDENGDVGRFVHDGS
jgi:hypothetical protein